MSRSNILTAESSGEWGLWVTKPAGISGWLRSSCESERVSGAGWEVLLGEAIRKVLGVSAAAAVASVMSDSMRPHRRQPTRLPRPWDSLGKNTGVGCQFLLQCMKVKSESEVAQSCLTLRDPMDYRLPGSSIHGIFQTGFWTAVNEEERYRVVEGVGSMV